MERYIAVDNVCAWPNLTQLPNGDIVAAIFNQPAHGRWEGDVDCWASRDGGRLWSWRGTAARHDPGNNRMNVAAGLCPDGSLLVIASGWDKRPSPPRTPAEEAALESKNVFALNLPSLIYRSADGGVSWHVIGQFDKYDMDGSNKKYWIPFGDIITLADGRLAFAAYSANRKGVRIQFSEDNGNTWSEPVSIVDSDQYHNETAIISPDGKTILAAVRCEEKRVLELYRSEDCGQTWSCEMSLTLRGQMPGHILKLQDGALLLTYGIRNKPFCGIGARFSTDEGKSWGEPIFLVNFENVADCGYPSSVQTEDGTIVTAYYCKNIPTHNRYHMGVVRWRHDDFPTR